MPRPWHHEPLRQVAADNGVFYETIRRLLRASRKKKAGWEAFNYPCLLLGTLEQDGLCSGLTSLTTCSRIAPVPVAQQFLQLSQSVSNLPRAHLSLPVPHALSAYAGT